LFLHDEHDGVLHIASIGAFAKKQIRNLVCPENQLSAVHPQNDGNRVSYKLADI